MVRLNMIDTQGGGIKKMFQFQMKRYLPLPDYDLSTPERVVVTIQGRVLDENYTRLLMERTDLDLWAVILLDKVQKRIRIDQKEHQQLKKLGLVEGRYPNILISSKVAAATDEQAKHIRLRGFNKKYYLDMIVELIQTHEPVSRKKIDDLLMNILPGILTENQKKNKIHNLLRELARNEIIVNSGSRRSSAWRINQ